LITAYVLLVLIPSDLFLGINSLVAVLFVYYLYVIASLPFRSPIWPIMCLVGR